jgi:hypothetical protein
LGAEPSESAPAHFCAVFRRAAVGLIDVKNNAARRLN